MTITSIGGAIAIAGCGVVGPIIHTYSVCICWRSHCAHYGGITKNSMMFS